MSHMVTLFYPVVRQLQQMSKKTMIELKKVLKKRRSFSKVTLIKASKRPRTEPVPTLLTVPQGFESHHRNHRNEEEAGRGLTVQDIGKLTSVPSAATVSDSFMTIDDFCQVDDSDDMQAFLRQSGLMTDDTQAPLQQRKAIPRFTVLQSRNTVVERYMALQMKSTLWQSQVEAVDFIEKHEQERRLDIAGGIIGDEMGLGKTLQFLSVVHRNLRKICIDTGSPYGQATLVVVPKTLLSTWRNEIALHCPAGMFSVLILGEGLNPNVSEDTIRRQYNLVFTTYPTIVSAFNTRRQHGSRKTGAYDILFTFSWWRIIADEGHHFFNRDTTRYTAMCELKSHFRWIATGTPVLNDVSDACAGLRFLCINPKYLPDDQSARQERVSGTIAADRSEEKRAQLEHMRYKFAYLLQVRDVLHQVMLRRTDKRDRYRTEVRLSDFETQAERDVYNVYYERFRRNCLAVRKTKTTREEAPQSESDSLEEGEIEEEHGEGEDPPRKRARLESTAAPKAPNTMNTLTVDILRMRQICVAPTVVSNLEIPPHILLDRGYTQPLRDAANTQERIIRAAPRGVMSLSYLAAAKVATHCVDPVSFVDVPVNTESACPLVLWLYEVIGKETWGRFVKDRDTYNRLVNTLRHVHARVLPSVGTKVRMFMRHLRNDFAPDEKYLIFSDWVAVLNVMREAFAQAGHASSMLTGQQTSAEREMEIREFEASKEKQVFLISLMVGSAGLNLHCANQVSHADPWWNPQTMKQAVYRILRPGQTKYGHVFNVIMRNTIEEDVNRMCEEKQWISHVLLDTDPRMLAIIKDMRKVVEDSGDIDPGQMEQVAQTTEENVSLHTIAQQIMRPRLGVSAPTTRGRVLQLMDRIFDEQQQ